MLRDEPEVEPPFEPDDSKTAPFGGCCVCGRGAWMMLHTTAGRAALCCHDDCGAQVEGSEAERAEHVRRLQGKRKAPLQLCPSEAP